MLVKKLKTEWKPSENLGLQVGETIDMTDPQQLILDGMCIAVGEDGEELDAFDLYGVVSEDLMGDLKAFKASKHQEQIKKELDLENSSLNEELKEIKAKTMKKAYIVELDAMPWADLRKQAIAEGVLKPSMKRAAVTEALIAKLD